MGGYLTRRMLAALCIAAMFAALSFFGVHL